MTNDILKRIQTLCGSSWRVRFDDDLLVIMPAEIKVEMRMTSQDLALSNKKLVEIVLNPMLDNLQMMLDQERPYHLTRHQETIAKAQEVYSRRPSRR